jgi:hypothetical protein
MLAYKVVKMSSIRSAFTLVPLTTVIKAPSRPLVPEKSVKPGMSVSISSRSEGDGKNGIPLRCIQGSLHDLGRFGISLCTASFRQIEAEREDNLRLTVDSLSKFTPHVPSSWVTTAFLRGETVTPSKSECTPREGSVKRCMGPNFKRP